jgi:hypothetical protein
LLDRCLREGNSAARAAKGLLLAAELAKVDRRR